MENLLLTIPQASSALQLGRSKVYELLQAQELKAVRVGRSVRIPATEVERFVRRLQEESADGRLVAEQVPGASNGKRQTRRPGACTPKSSTLSLHRPNRVVGG